jgi:hypothetical protein
MWELIKSLDFEVINLGIDCIIFMVVAGFLINRNPLLLLVFAGLIILPWIYPLPLETIGTPPTKKGPAFLEPPQASEEGSVGGLDLSVATHALKVVEDLGISTSAPSPLPNIETVQQALALRIEHQRATRGQGFYYEPPGQADHMVWFLIRIFWLAAGIYLFTQRMWWGVAALSLNMFPIPYLLRGFPLWAYQLNRSSQITTADLMASDGEFRTQWWEIHGTEFMTLSTFVVLGGGILITLFLGARNLLGLRREKTLTSFLNPKEYKLICNGEAFDFSVKGDRLEFADVSWDLRGCAVDTQNPGKVMLRTGTQIEFVPR